MSDIADTLATVVDDFVLAMDPKQRAGVVVSLQIPDRLSDATEAELAGGCPSPRERQGGVCHMARRVAGYQAHHLRRRRGERAQAFRQLGGTPRESQPKKVADGSRANPANDLPDATTPPATATSPHIQVGDSLQRWNRPVIKPLAAEGWSVARYRPFQETRSYRRLSGFRRIASVRNRCISVTPIWAAASASGCDTLSGHEPPFPGQYYEGLAVMVTTGQRQPRQVSDDVSR